MISTKIKEGETSNIIMKIHMEVKLITRKRNQEMKIHTEMVIIINLIMQTQEMINIRKAATIIII